MQKLFSKRTSQTLLKGLSSSTSNFLPSSNFIPNSFRVSTLNSSKASEFISRLKNMNTRNLHSLIDDHHHVEGKQILPRYSERGLEESIVMDEENQPHKFVLINGLEIAAEIKEEIKKDIERIVEKQKGEIKRPGLAVVMVGSRKDSLTYVQRKQEACAELGIESFKTHFEDDQLITDEDVIECIRKYNNDDKVHGILVQLPLPPHLNEEKILESISPTKDVDGLTQFSFGLISMKGRKLVDGINFVPCTPLGIMEMIKRTAQKLDMNLDGLDSVVVGASNIVGIPTALVLLNQLQTSVQLLHIKSQNIPEKISKADILVVCCGCAEIVKPEWIKKGAIVIDVGLTPVEDKTQERGFRLVGDVLFDENLKKRASAATPVPGGVGPVTIASLMKNTYHSFLSKNPDFHL